MCLCHVYMGAQRPQKKLESLELKMAVVMCVLGTELRPSGRAKTLLTTEPFLQCLILIVTFQEKKEVYK